MATTTAPTQRLALPDDFLIGEFSIELNIDDEQEARQKAELLFAEMRGVFLGRHAGFALWYDIEFEITETWSGSSGFGGRIWGRLKASWQDVKSKTPKVFAVIVFGLGGIAGYPAVRDGAVQIGKDARSAWEMVVDRHKESEPATIKSAECRVLDAQEEGGDRKKSQKDKEAKHASQQDLKETKPQPKQARKRR